LSTQDWIAKNPGELKQMTRGPSETDFPLLTSIFFLPILAGFHGNHIKIIRLLLENGFQVSADQYFFPLICLAMSDSESGKHPRSICQLTLLEAAALMLQNGQDPNVIIKLRQLPGLLNNSNATFITASALHVCLPALAQQVLQHGGDPNCLDGQGRTALD
jgi:hypothetical protein